MWSDPKTQATYTQAQKDDMTGLPAYKNLLKRLVQTDVAPEPVAAEKERKPKKDDSTNSATTE